MMALLQLAAACNGGRCFLRCRSAYISIYLRAKSLVKFMRRP